MESKEANVLLLLLFACLNLVFGNPTVWLEQPPSRAAERFSTTKRLPEAMCPTFKMQKDIVSPVPSGTSFKVTWRNVTNEEPESTKIELLSSAGLNNILAKLDIEGEPVFDPLNGTTSVNIVIPHQMSCQECVIRLTLELRDRTQAVSCADVQVLEVASSPSVRLVDVDCVEDDDCGRDNECFQGHCFCRPGAYGLRCSESSKNNFHFETIRNWNQTIRFPNSNINLLWDIDDDFIDMELKLGKINTDEPTKWWFVLGMQSKEDDPMCLKILSEQKFQESSGLSSENTHSLVVVEGVPLHQKQRENNALTNTLLQPADSVLNTLKILKIDKNQQNPVVCGENERFEKCPEVSRECEPSCDWIAFPDQIPTCPPKSDENCGEPRCVCNEGFVRFSTEKDECKPFSFCQASEVVQECQQNETWAKCGNICEPTCDTVFSPEPCHTVCEQPGCRCADNFVRTHSGQCVYWGSCSSEKHPHTFATAETSLPETVATTSSPSLPFEETYTKTTTIGSTSDEKRALVTATDQLPSAELPCPFNETLNECGRVCEADCKSIFDREECRECSVPACSCQQGFARNNGVCVYWGDCPDFPASPDIKSEFEAKKLATVDQSCVNEFRWPDGCSFENCDYLARWSYNAIVHDVQFNISSRGLGRWTGIGFSRSGQMANSDIYTGWVYDGKAYVTDRFAFSQNSPAIDPSDSQDIYDVFGSTVDEIQTISFRRKVITGDKQTDFQLDECFYFLFPIGGGRVLVKNNRDFQSAKTPIGYHDQYRPQVSSTKHCICGDDRKPIGGRRQKVGRNKRAPQSAESAGQQGGYSCADVTIIEVKREKARVVDGFGLSAALLMPDESWGGRQSFADVSVRKDADSSIVVSIKRPLTDKLNDRADLGIQRERNISIFLAFGSGLLNLTAANVEFATIETAVPQQHSMNPIKTFTSAINKSSSTTKPPATSTEQSSSTAFSTRKKDIFKTSSASSETFFTDTPNDTISLTAAKSSPTTLSGASSETSSHFETTEAKATTIEELDVPKDFDENCVGGFVWPESCLKPNGDFSQCSYMAEWQVQPSMDTVNFHLFTTYAPDTWTGIGFSRNGKMADADVIVVSVLNEDIAVTDQFSPGYGRPRLDSVQDIYNIASGSVEGKLYVNFSRSLTTEDLADDVDLTKCAYFLFIHSGGPLEAESKEILKHTQTPTVSKNAICLGKCHSSKVTGVEEVAVTSPETSTSPAKKSSAVASTSQTTTVTVKTTAEEQTTTTPTTTTETTTEEQELTTTTIATTTEKQERTTTTTATTSTKSSRTTSTPSPTSTSTTTLKTTPSTTIFGKTKASSSDLASTIRGNGENGEFREKPSDKPGSKGAEDDSGCLTIEMTFDVAIKLVDEKWSEQLANSSTREFALLETKLKNFLSPVLSSRWSSLKEINILQFAKGSVLALIQVHFQGERVPLTAEQFKEFLKEVAVSSGTNKVRIDAQMLEVKDAQIEIENKWGPLRDIQIWAMVCLALLGLLAVTALLVLFTCRKRNVRTYPKQPPFIGAPSNYHLYTPYPTYAANNKNGMSSEKDTSDPKQKSGDNSKADERDVTNAECPGIGEATYREWYTKVASKESSSHVQENNNYLHASGTLGRQHPSATYGTHTQSYVTYPNDPNIYYTMNGEHRIPPPPAYYRHY